MAKDYRPSLKDAVNATKKDVAVLPAQKGCYAFFTRGGKCTYVGQTRHIRSRVSSHWKNGMGKSLKGGVVCFWITDKQVELEKYLINFLEPTLNKQRYESYLIDKKWAGSFKYHKDLGKVRVPKNGYWWTIKEKVIDPRADYISFVLSNPKMYPLGQVIKCFTNYGMNSSWISNVIRLMYSRIQFGDYTPFISRRSTFTLDKSKVNGFKYAPYIEKRY